LGEEAGGERSDSYFQSGYFSGGDYYLPIVVYDGSECRESQPRDDSGSEDAGTYENTSSSASSQSSGGSTVGTSASTSSDTSTFLRARAISDAASQWLTRSLSSLGK
jgi:hypothetical protein